MAALAIYGVRRYLANSKTAEAKQNVGAIARGAAAAYEREVTIAEDVGEGSTSANASHQLCADPQVANPVPAGARRLARSTSPIRPTAPTSRAMTAAPAGAACASA